MTVQPSAELLRRWTRDVRTRTGVHLHIRPLRPDDRERETAFINSLSERSRYFRLFTPLRFLSPHLLDQFMDIDYDRRMAIVATVVPDGGAEVFAGIARYGETDRPGTAELGVTVTDSWQHCGIGRLLVLELMRYARDRGVVRFSGVVLPENQPMLGLASSLGFAASYDSNQHLMSISRELGDLPVGSPAAGGPE